MATPRRSRREAPAGVAAAKMKSFFSLCFSLPPSLAVSHLFISNHHPLHPLIDFTPFLAPADASSSEPFSHFSSSPLAQSLFPTGSCVCWRPEPTAQLPSRYVPDIPRQPCQIARRSTLSLTTTMSSGTELSPALPSCPTSLTVSLSSPLCIEEFDISDKNFKPCPCGYQVRHSIFRPSWLPSPPVLRVFPSPGGSTVF